MVGRYKVPDVEHKAINDTLILESGIYLLLKHFCRFGVWGLGFGVLGMWFILSGADAAQGSRALH